MNGSTRTAAVALLLSSAALACASKPAASPVRSAITLPFIENDFAQAMAKARDANLPVFVEVWAPW
jgi:ABC-type sugar transport system substrate-binding protein